MEILYHGTDEKHNFSKSRGYISDGSFFSKDPKVAKGYGKYLYKVRLKTDNIFYPHKKECLDALFKEFKTLYDQWEDKNITKKEFYEASDTWDPIENTDGVVDWIMSQGYRGVEIIEGGSEVNYLLFYPNEDIEEIEEITENKIHRFNNYLTEKLGVVDNLDELCNITLKGLVGKDYFSLNTNWRGKDINIEFYVNKNFADLGVFKVVDFDTMKFKIEIRNRNRDIILHELKHLDRSILRGGKYSEHDYVNHVGDYVTGKYKHLAIDNDAAYLLTQAIYLSNPNEFDSYFNQYYYTLKRKLEDIKPEKRRKYIDNFLEKQEIFVLYKALYKNKFDLRQFFKTNKNTNLFLKDFSRILSEYKIDHEGASGISIVDILISKIPSFFDDSEVDKSINQINNIINNSIRNNYKKFGRLYTLLL